MLVADNLAAHAIGGYYQNFSTVQRFCRFCNRTKNDISNHRCNDVIRSSKAYDAQVSEVEKEPELCKLYGIKERSVLNELEHFHISNGAPGDLAHDVFEGFAIEFLTDIIVRLVRGKKVSLTQVNELIISFDYMEVHKRNKPQPIKEKALTQLKVKQTACEMWNLISLFPLIFGNLFETNDDMWELFIMFHKIIQRLCALQYREEDLVVLDEMIKSFLKSYCIIFPENNLKPKAHFLLHYPMNIRKFGPLIKTLRFESKHSYFKNSISSSRNRVNVSKSMATHHQMLMYLNYKMEHYFVTDDYNLTGVKEVNINCMPEYLKKLILQKCDLLSNTFMEGNSLSYMGARYSNGSAVVLCMDNEIPTFGEIVSVFLINDIPYLFCCVLDIIEYDSHINGYNVVHSDINVFYKVDELVDYHPLGIYGVFPRKSIILRHFIF